MIALYHRRVYPDGPEDDADRLRESDAVERTLRLAALRGEREHILGLVRTRRISDETSRRLLRDLDLLETMYR